MFSKLRVFFKTQGFFFRTQVFVLKMSFFAKSSLNIAHVIYLLTTIAGSKKMNVILRLNVTSILIDQPPPGKLSWESVGPPSGRSRVQIPAGPTLRIFNKWEESAAFVMTSAND